MLLAAHLGERGHARILGLDVRVVGGSLSIPRLLVEASPPPGRLEAQLITDTETQDILLNWPDLPAGDHVTAETPILLEIL